MISFASRSVKLVGGRVQLLFNPSITYTSLRSEVCEAVNAVPVEHLRRDSCLDYFEIPRLLYSLYPLRLGTHLTKFASPFTRDLVAHKRIQKESF